MCVNNKHRDEYAYPISVSGVNIFKYSITWDLWQSKYRRPMAANIVHGWLFVCRYRRAHELPTLLNVFLSSSHPPTNPPARSTITTTTRNTKSSVTNNVMFFNTHIHNNIIRYPLEIDRSRIEVSQRRVAPHNVVSVYGRPANVVPFFDVFQYAQKKGTTSIKRRR